MAYTTWDPDSLSAGTLSNGNLTLAGGEVRTTWSASSGQYYWEAVLDDANGGNSVGAICTPGHTLDTNGNIGDASTGWAYNDDGGIDNNGSTVSTVASLANGDVVGVALDLDAGAVWFAKNGTWLNGATVSEIESGDTTNALITGLSGEWHAAAATGSSFGQVSGGFDPSSWTHSAPSGFSGLTGPTTATGDTSISMSVSGSASNKTKRGTGDAAISLSAGGTARNTTKRATGDTAISLSASGSARNTVKRASGGVTISMSAEGSAGIEQGSIDASLGALACEITGYTGIIGAMEATLGRLSCDISGSIPITGSIDASLGDLEAQLSGSTQITGSIDASLGALSASVHGYFNITGSIDASLGILGARLDGTLEAGDQWTIIAINLSTGAVSEYTAYEFNSIIAWNGSYYGATDGGIYELAGTDDDGANIAAHITTGITDHGTGRTKRASDAYLSGDFANATLTMLLDEGASSNDYAVVGGKFDAHKTNLGRGARARYFQYKVANKDGGDLELDAVDVIVSPTQRRKR